MLNNEQGGLDSVDEINCRQIKVTSVILIRSRFVNIYTENSLTWQLISDDVVT